MNFDISLLNKRVWLSMFLFAVLLLSGCAIDAPKAPNWDLTMQIPIINKQYSSAELIDKLGSENIIIDSSGSAFFYHQQTLDSISIDQTLQLDDLNSSFSQEVGEIKISTPASQSEFLAFADYIPLIASEIPDTGLWVTKPYDSPNTITEAVISEGAIYIEAVNNTGFPLDTVICQLWRSNPDEIIFSFNIPNGLAEDESYNDTLSLNGASLSSELNLKIFFHTPGGTALTLANRSIDFNFSYSDPIYASSVTGKTDNFISNYQSAVKLQTDYQIESATLANGQLNYNITNNLNLAVDLEVVFPGLLEHNQPKVISLSLPAHGTDQVQFDMSGWELVPDGDSISAQITASIISSAGQDVTITSSDNFNFSYIIDNLEISSAMAVVSATEIELSNNVVNLDIPDGFENTSLDQVDLELKIYNGSQLSGQFEILLAGSNGKSFTLNGILNAGSNNSAAITIIRSDELADLLSPIPKTITASGLAIVGDGVSLVEISNADFIFAEATFSAPLSFSLQETTFEGDKELQEIDEEISDRADRLLEGSFKGTVTNHLPLGGELIIYLSTDSASLYTNPEVTIGPFSIQQAPVDNNGNVNNSIETENNISLTSDELKIFQNRNIYIGEIINIPSSNGNTVNLRASDYIEIIGTIEITAHVGGEDF